MTRVFCNDCEKPLADQNFISIENLRVFDREKGVGSIGRLDFCDADCCKSWLVKNINRPNMSLS